MCSPFSPADCVELVQAGVKLLTEGPAAIPEMAADYLLKAIADSVVAALQWTTGLLASWVLIPSTDVCTPKSAVGDAITRILGGNPDAAWMNECNSSAYPAVELRAYMLPITVMIAVAGIIWQGIAMTISRKGEPLLQALRGTWNTALWGAVGIVGTQMALKAGDAYSWWILKNAVFSNSNAPPNEAFSVALGGILVAGPGLAPFMVIIFGLISIIAVIVQAVLMVFREGAVVILAGLLQLAAAGSFTRSTSPWLQRVTGWMLALVCYKPMAATIYAVGFMLLRSTETSGRNFVMGLAVLALSVVAMPALMKFFNWTVGSMASGGGGLGVFGAGAAAGVHAASSLRGAGGFSPGEHIRYMDGHGPGSGGAPSGAAGSTSSSATAASSAPTGAATTASTAAAGSTASAGGAAAGGGAAAAGGSAAAGGAAAGAAATGVGIPVAVGIVAAQAAVSTAKSAANAAGSSMQDGK